MSRPPSPPLPALPSPSFHHDTLASDNVDSTACKHLTIPEWSSIETLKTNPIPLPPDTIWIRLARRTSPKYGRFLLDAASLLGAIVLTIVVLAGLGCFRKESSWKIVYGTPGDFVTSGTGDATYYDPSIGVGACGWTAGANDMVCALNVVDFGAYANPSQSPACGACLNVTGPLGSVQVTIIDKCPVCQKGDVDLTEAAFSKISPVAAGRVHVQWTRCER
ncbi:hypothetical protein BZG36_04621 [Bifiguratus adelaidae]|uniref:Uncharacterized protein n=1 Tax=Bifiguratus adelaidae TaxID=1938954 RepID=A0A261XXA5_9FUNG|nr:hypothetical protein BZG36_04621 [Bifiguratus adelaidae]